MSEKQPLTISSDPIEWPVYAARSVMACAVRFVEGQMHGGKMVVDLLTGNAEQVDEQLGIETREVSPK